MFEKCLAGFIYLYQILIQVHRAVCPAAEEPRLCGVEGDVQHTEAGNVIVPAEHLDGNDERVPCQVVEDARVKDVDRTVVGAGGHQGVVLVKPYTPHRLAVVSQRLKRHLREVHVKPHDPFVVTAHGAVVATGVDLHARDPFRARPQLAHERLRDKVVHANLGLRRNEKERFVGME